MTCRHLPCLYKTALPTRAVLGPSARCQSTPASPIRSQTITAGTRPAVHCPYCLTLPCRAGLCRDGPTPGIAYPCLPCHAGPVPEPPSHTHHRHACRAIPVNALTTPAIRCRARHYRDGHADPITASPPHAPPRRLRLPCRPEPSTDHQRLTLPVPSVPASHRQSLPLHSWTIRSLLEPALTAMPNRSQRRTDALRPASPATPISAKLRHTHPTKS